LPWTVCWPAVVVGLRRASLGQPILPYCGCWVVGPLLLFSASSGKLEPYVLPCFPPLAMLTAIGLIEHARLTGCRRRPFDYAIAGLIVAVLLVVVVDTQLNVIGLAFFGPGQQWRLWLLAGSLAMCLGLVLAAISATTPNRRILLSVLATVGILATGHFLVPLKLLKPSQFPVAMIRDNADLVDEQTLLVADPYLVHAVAWVFRRDDVHLLTDAGELAYGLQVDETQTRGPHVEPGDIRRLLDDTLPDRRVVVFTRHRTILAATEPADTRGAEGLWVLEFE
jgi:4-amino-4-deoxy-L-arabinose transferase